MLLVSMSVSSPQTFEWPLWNRTIHSSSVFNNNNKIKIWHFFMLWPFYIYCFYAFVNGCPPGKMWWPLFCLSAHSVRKWGQFCFACQLKCWCPLPPENGQMGYDLIISIFLMVLKMVVPWQSVMTSFGTCQLIPHRSEKINFLFFTYHIQMIIPPPFPPPPPKKKKKKKNPGSASEWPLFIQWF